MTLRLPLRTLLCVLLAVAVLPGLSHGAGREKPKPEATEVEFFAAMKSGEIAVRFIPKDSTQANVLIQNRTKQPLRIKLPEAFAGVPVLAQFGGGMMGGGGMGGMGGGGMGGGGMGGGGGQGMGGGMGGGGMGGMGGGGMGGMGGGGMMGGGGGFFNVAPEKVGKIKVATVCLEHGKPDPNPNMKYTIVPIDSFTDKPDVVELCKMLGRGEVPQNAAQAAAWHLANDLSWDELAHKDRVRLMSGYYEKFFSPRELGFAVQIAGEAVRRAEQFGREKSDSLSTTPTSLRQ